MKAFVAMACLLLATGCGDASEQGRGGGSDVAVILATAPSLALLAERLVGERGDVVVRCIVPEDADATHWVPTRDDLLDLRAASLVLVHGAGLETWTDSVALPSSRTVDTSLALAGRLIVREELTHTHGGAGEHTHRGLDPHVWLDPALVVLQLEYVAAELERRGWLREGVREELRTSLGALAERLAAWPDGGPVIHADATGLAYLARALGREFSTLDVDVRERRLTAEVLAALPQGFVLLCSWPPSDGVRDQLAERGVRCVAIDARLGAASPDRFGRSLDVLREVW